MPSQPQPRPAPRASAPGRAILAASVVLNVLLPLILWQRSGVSRLPSRPEAPNPNPVSVGSGWEPSREPLRRAGRVAPSAPTPWSRLVSTNLEQYAVNLQRAGCPAETLCDLLGPAVELQFEEGIQQLPRSADFWAMGEARRCQREEAERHRAALLEEKGRLRALWACAALPAEEMDVLTLRMIVELTAGFLAPGRPEAVIQCMLTAEARTQEWEARTRNLPLPEELAAIRREREELLHRLQSLISDPELEEVALRLSRLMNEHRFADATTGSALGVTPREYREMCRIQDSLHNEMLGEWVPFRDLLNEERPDRPVEEVEADLLALLGETRFREFRRLEDPGFQEAMKLAGASGLSPGVPDRVHELLESFRLEVPALRQQWAEARESGRLQLRARREEWQRQIQELLAGVPDEERQEAVRGWTEEVIRSRWERP